LNLDIKVQELSYSCGDPVEQPFLRINAGTTAANWQPRHTRDAPDSDKDSDDDFNTCGGLSTSSTIRLRSSEAWVSETFRGVLETLFPISGL